MECIQRIPSTEKYQNEEYQFQEMMKNYPEDRFVHRPSVKCKELVFSGCFSGADEKKIIFPEQSVNENDEWIREGQNDREDEVENFPFDVVFVPVKVVPTEFLPEKVLIEWMTDKLLVAVPH